jgi:hypothetical protein
MIKNNNYLDSLSKSLLNDVRGVMEGKKKVCKCENNCACGKEEKGEAQEKGEVKEAKKMKGEDPCWKDYKMIGTKKGKGGKEVPNCVPEETEIKEGEEKGGGYNATAVNKAIKSSRQKIGGREAKMIHALLKGRTPKNDVKEEVDMGQAERGMRSSSKHTGGYHVVDKAGKVISKHKGQRDAMQSALKNDDYKVKAVKEEVELDEEVDFAKVRKQFDRNEDRNAHSENAVLIAKHAGTDAHHKEANDILKQHKKLGHLSGDLSDRRQALYKQLKNTDNYKKIFPEEFKEEVELDEGEEKGGGYNGTRAKGAMVYKKVLGQHTVHKGNTFHRSFPSEGDAVKYIQKNQGKKDVNEAKAESPIKGTRLISKHEGKDGHHAEVRHNSEYNEFQVHHYENGKHMGEGPVSYHDTKADAKETAEYEVKNYRPKGGSLHKEETLAEKLIGKQHKLDKNKNGKLDKQDFKMLRKEETIEEKLDPSMGAGKYVTDFVKSKDPRFEGKTKKERIKMALGAYYGAKNESVDSEQIDEISSELANRYVDKARPDRGFGDEQKARLSQTKRDNRQRYGNVAREKIFAAKNPDKETSVRVPATRNEEVDHVQEGYGDKRDYKKHHISVNGKYVATTTWAKSAREAEKKFIEAHPEHKNARITVVKER